MTQVGTWMHRILARALESAGLITVFLTLGAIGVAALIGGPGKAPWAGLAAFGLVGAIEVIHRQTQANIEKLCDTAYMDRNEEILFAIAEKNPGWNPVVFKEFKHGGFLWQAVRFEKYPIAFAITGPYCPRCGNNLTERLEVLFPLRTRRLAICTCDYTAIAKLPFKVLKNEAHQLSGPTK